MSEDVGDQRLSRHISSGYGDVVVEIVAGYFVVLECWPGETCTRPIQLLGQRGYCP